MQAKTLLILAAAVALVAACDRNGPPSHSPSPSVGASQMQGTTPSSPSKPSESEKREGANPTQGQVDPKEPAQHRDFQQKDDAKGPTNPDTAPGK